MSPRPSGEPVARLVHETLQEQAYQELRKAIREGRFVSGQALTVRGLAAMLGVSPMPVREAVRRLAQEKTLELAPNRTMRVPQLSPRRFDELAEIRAEIEGYAAGRAAEQMTAETFAEITLANEAMSRAVDKGDVAEINLMNERFHFSIYRAAGSETMLSVIEGLWQQSGPYLASLIKRLVGGSDMPTSFALAHHYELLAALAKRDAAAARETMKADIVESARWYRSSLASARPMAVENRTAR
ncbi:GntR family transcriptional regulator [Roseiarcus fermentans]|uniref:GntR family transcriptional regulator n=1 Tax=Roseiarcus fermentans TaxID=1473586 RepID=A0A366FHB4_9HYPH|nr:GntR family transcriptional regulator [Roseiarcus fermentans]RBP13991.1 GntR family transcriptional regulator [Roseiarcus fermentans]